MSYYDHNHHNENNNNNNHDTGGGGWNCYDYQPHQQTRSVVGQINNNTMNNSGQYYHQGFTNQGQHYHQGPSTTQQQQQYQQHQPQQYPQQLQPQQYQPQQYQRQQVAPTYDQPLPPNWAETVDPTSGTTYYYNSVTRETSWDRPTNHPPLQPEQQQHHHQQQQFGPVGTLPPLIVTQQHQQQEQRLNPSIPHYQDQEYGSFPVVSSHVVPTIIERPISSTNNATYGGVDSNSTFSKTISSSSMATTTVQQQQQYPHHALVMSDNLIAIARQVLDRTSMADNTQTSTSAIAMNDNDGDDTVPELTGLTAGQVVDLCKLQRRLLREDEQDDEEGEEDGDVMDKDDDNNGVDDGDKKGSSSTKETKKRQRGRKTVPPYTPINPYTMSLSSTSLLERTERGRLDVRLHSLRKELVPFGYGS